MTELLRVLFVDDEQAVLDGLRNRLRRQRSKWTLSFANGGPAAAELLTREKFDVVVTDMRMPQIDGAELLRRVHRDHPHTVRIVLSGHAEMSAMLRVVPVAHRYLGKPCDPEELEQAIERAGRLSRCASSDGVKRLVGTVRALPPAPHLYAELTKHLEDPNAGTAEVAALVGRDVAMSAKILQIVNSAFIGPRRPIDSVERAVNYLGLQTIQSLVLAVEVFRPGSGQTLSKDLIDRAHRRGLLVGRLAAKLFDDKIKSQEALLAGMMHDVGELVLITEFTDAYEELDRTRDADERPQEVREVEQFGASHAEVGAHLLELWGLPHSAGESAAYHHCPRDIEQKSFDTVHAVHAAHELVIAALRGDVSRHAMDLELLERMGMSGRVPVWMELARAIVESEHGGGDR